jgi:hypothetical protein
LPQILVDPNPGEHGAEAVDGGRLTLWMALVFSLKNTEVDAMAVKKVAISLPPETLKQIDHAAKETGESRSGFIARICMLAATAKSDREIRRKINKLFADPEIAREQVETSEAMLRAGHAAGTEWEEG